MKKWTIRAAVLMLCCTAGTRLLHAKEIVVAADGSGDFASLQAAVASVPKNNRERLIIRIKPGIYREKIRIEASYVTLMGSGKDQTKIEFAQLNEEYDKKPDGLGRAVVNIEASNTVIRDLTIQNTAGIVGPHSFSIYGSKCDQTVIVDCDVLSEGADTVSLWEGKTGRYYHARCNFRGAVDFVCPRGWCYVRDSTFFETKVGSAAIWHDGSKEKDQKFVLQNCKFDGVKGWVLGRHHHDAQVFLLGCSFAEGMDSRPPIRVRYPLTGPESEADRTKNETLNKTNQWGERWYFWKVAKAGEQIAWMNENIDKAEGVPVPEEMSAKWTFAKARGEGERAWDPERTDGPTVVAVTNEGESTVVEMSEEVTVRGIPKAAFEDGSMGAYISGSGSKRLVFSAGKTGKLIKIEVGNGSIVACEASATERKMN